MTEDDIIFIAGESLKRETKMYEILYKKTKNTDYLEFNEKLKMLLQKIARYKAKKIMNTLKDK